MKNYNKAKVLRKNQTTQEQKLWSLLRNRSFHNLKFKRQYPIGSYIVDFICLEKNIVIEIDGGQHNTDENIKYDNKRTEFLNSKGFKVVEESIEVASLENSFDGFKIMQIFKIAKRNFEYLTNPHPNPSPLSKGEGEKM